MKDLEECDLMDPIVSIRGAYWLGALLDAWIGLQVIFPRKFGHPFGIRSLGTEIQYTLWLCSGLTFGWTVLLLWGSLYPIERRFLLILTVIPVMVGLVLTNLGGYRTDYLSRRTATKYCIIETFVVGVYLYAYFLAARMGG